MSKGGILAQSFFDEWAAMFSGHFVPYHKLAVLVALITSFFFSITFSHDIVFEAPVAVIDLDASRYSAQFIEKLNASPYISVREVLHFSILMMVLHPIRALEVFACLAVGLALSLTVPFLALVAPAGIYWISSILIEKVFRQHLRPEDADKTAIESQEGTDHDK